MGKDNSTIFCDFFFDFNNVTDANIKCFNCNILYFIYIFF